MWGQYNYPLSVVWMPVMHQMTYVRSICLPTRVVWMCYESNDLWPMWGQYTYPPGLCECVVCNKWPMWGQYTYPLVLCECVLCNKWPMWGQYAYTPGLCECVLWIKWLMTYVRSIYLPTSVVWLHAIRLLYPYDWWQRVGCLWRIVSLLVPLDQMCLDEEG